MALSEAEELELLQLQKAKAMGSAGAINGDRPFSVPIAKTAALQALNLLPQAHPIENLPQIAGTTGLALAGPGGMAAGTGLGKIAQNMIGIAQGDPNAPRTAMGAALPAMGETAMAGIAQEPKVLQEIPGVPKVTAMASNMLSKMGKGLARGVETRTGVKAKDITQAAKQGISTYAAPSMEKASQIFGEALGPEGKAAMQQPASEAFDASLGKARSLASDVGDKLEKFLAGSGEPPTAIEALKARQATDRIISSTPPTDKMARKVLYDWREKFDALMESQSGELKDASTKYRQSIVKDKILNITRLNKSGEPSAFLPMLAGHAMGNSIRAGLGLLAGTSPLLAGAAATVGGSTARGLAKLGENPAVRQALLQVLQRIQKKPNAH